jgi:hypothetical protein
MYNVGEIFDSFVTLNADGCMRYCLDAFECNRYTFYNDFCQLWYNITVEFPQNDAVSGK